MPTTKISPRMCYFLFLVQIRRLLYFAPSSRLPVELKAQKVINPILSAKVLSTVQLRINLDSFRQGFSLWIGKLSYFKKNRTAGLSQSISRNQNSLLYKLANQGKVPLKKKQKCLVGWDGSSANTLLVSCGQKTKMFLLLETGPWIMNEH